LRKEWAVYFNFKTDAAAGVNLDMKHVSAFDITGVQLLCSARKTAALNHKIFTVSEASEEVIKAVSDAGLDPDKLFAAA
jgi:anti-anti-sigma regulatory factor